VLRSGAAFAIGAVDLGRVSSPAMEGCIACATLTGEIAVPAGAVWEGDEWLVDHCLGPWAPGAPA
jgi:hypothetical protein